jgi:hypothetical protein
MARLARVESAATSVELIVNDRIHRGVCLVLPEHEIRFETVVRGPLRTTIEMAGRPVLTRLTSGEEEDLRERARVVQRNDAADAPPAAA